MAGKKLLVAAVPYDSTLVVAYLLIKLTYLLEFLFYSCRVHLFHSTRCSTGINTEVCFLLLGQ